ncbi:MAG: LPS export ABC transporter periplasmic protein LptC [Candidatus Omnitrophica bacterium]|nr:LPS export ABC transporter periplasmic protein LptC [Candidatus Omnitrophota bacterium]
MRYTIYLIFMSVFFFASVPISQGSAKQEIDDFYLSNFKKDGSSDWEIEGKEAIVDGDYIDIKTMNANYYTDSDTISAKSNKAKLNKKSQNIQLDGNVVIENKEGWNLKTDHLDWQQKENYIKTDSPVYTEKDEFLVKAEGLYADSQLKKANFKKDVQVTYREKDKKNATTINCDGPLEIDYNKSQATFKDNVVVNHAQGKLFSDVATLFFDKKEKTITKIVSEGHVKIIRDSNVTFAKKATYLASEEKLILEGSPRLIYFPDEENNSSSGFFGID